MATIRSFFLFLVLSLSAGLMSGCTVVSADRAFPTVTWYWTKAAQREREARAEAKAFDQSLHQQTK